MSLRVSGAPPPSTGHRAAGEAWPEDGRVRDRSTRHVGGEFRRRGEVEEGDRLARVRQDANYSDK